MKYIRKFALLLLALACSLSAAASVKPLEVIVFPGGFDYSGPV